MSKANIPRPDREAAAWMKNLAQQLEQSPGTYYVAPEMVAEVAAAVTAFRSALATALTLRTRTQIAVAAKNAARGEAERVCRRAYMLVKGDRRVSAAALISLGVRPPKGRRSASTAPQTRPRLQVNTVNQLHTIQWVDEASPRRGKPAGCAMLQLFVAVDPAGAGEQADPSRAQLLNVYTGNRVTLPPQAIDAQRPDIPRALRSDDPPPVATFFARWAGPKGQPGPWSQPASVRLAA